jgi:EAL domain-containing protein (putative c-di-GMP-specific phosphodiesterase class I)
MYIPILLAGMFLGSPYGLIAALIGGIVLGPIMPLEVSTGEPQLLMNWMYRLLMFVAIGGLSQHFSSRFRRKALLNKKLMSTNIETDIPNTNSLIDYPCNSYKYTVITVLVSDRVDITEIFGGDIFIQIMYKTFKHLKAELPKDSIIIQTDTDKLGIIYPQGESKLDAEKINKILSKSITVDDINIYVEFYVGVCTDKSLKECKTLIPFRESDKFARHAKKYNLTYVISNETKIQKPLQIELLGDFAQALEKEETFLTYQPIVNLTNMDIIGFEALIRWNHPTKGLIYPNDFIPLIERTKLVHPLFDWVIQKSLAKINEFKQHKIDTIVSINLSAKNFKSQNLSKKVIDMVKNANIIPYQLKLEITETVLMDNPEESQNIIKQFRENGLKIAIDDFGTGYSSFSYLSKFHVDYLKIDYSFISRIHEPAIFEIIKAMINLAHQLKFEAIAEGIETKEQLKQLIDLGCDYAQGYLFAKPIHQDDVIDYYKKTSTYDFI